MATTEVITVQRRRKYHWPEAQLNFWFVIMIISSSVVLGIFAYLTSVQNSLKLGIPWYASPSSFPSPPKPPSFPLIHLPPYLPSQHPTNSLINRILPYMITTSALCIIFIIILLGLISQQQLLPGVVVLGSFILFVLWLTGLIETSIQLYGPSGAINSYCNSRPNTQVIDSQQTAVWLANQSLCGYFLVRANVL
ncbi:MAG: hypothetical protein Q9179_007636 [Wetmoreana sp. 5 TL-2023]